MRVFLDTNILLDIVEQRMPHYPVSLAVLERCDDLDFELFIAWHGLATVFYITAQKQSEAGATNLIRNLLSWATVTSSEVRWSKTLASSFSARQSPGSSNAG